MPGDGGTAPHVRADAGYGGRGLLRASEQARLLRVRGASGFEGFTAAKSGCFDNFTKTAPATCRGIIGYFPTLKNVRIIRIWAGFIDVCADGVPVIGVTYEVPGLVISCGFTGHGFGISPTAGLTLAELAIGEKTTVGVSALRYDRFKAKI